MNSNALKPASFPSQEWLVGGGEMAKVIKSKDWSQTPLGPIESWPQSLRTTVSLVQASNSPISLAWGPGHVQIYNDGFWPICGDKHPTSMGQDFRECWASAFPVVGEAYAMAWSGKSAYLEKMRMFLDRNGFLEETWFTFSFSPITDESGKVAGLFNPVTEMSGQMLSQRRTKTLRDLATRTGKARTSTEAFALCAQVLGEADLDLPFVLIYLLDAQAEQARLVARTGLKTGTPACPEIVDLRASGDPLWSIAEVARTGSARQLDDAQARLAGAQVGPYPEIPRTAFALPITLPGSAKPAAVMVAGASARLPVNEAYRSFCDLAAAAVGAALANARAYEEERERAKALAEIDRVKTAFFTNVSHEFRTPLTLMLGPLEDELAEEKNPLPPERRERLETVHRNSLRLLKLVNTLLDFSRIESGRVLAAYVATDLAVYTADLASIFRAAVEKAGLTLNIDCPGLPEPVYVDREMWEKVVLNLLSNAFKHTFEGGIDVKLRWREGCVELTVADTGVGIRPEELPRLFERFHQIKEAKSRTHEGTGIGLALVRQLVQLHGGTITVESREGKGSIFKVALKTGRDHLPADQVKAASTPSSTAPRAAAYAEEAIRWLPELMTADVEPEASARRDFSKKRIVVADDNADMREYLRKLLAGRYEVVVTANGKEALAAIRGRRPDLILSDIMMPVMDGLELLKELRADLELRTLPVIFLSARAGEEAKIGWIGLGVDDYIVKPFSVKELLARVQTQLNLSEIRENAIKQVAFANAELETFNYSVAHDLRAPLRSIDGFSKLLLDKYAEKIDEEGRDFLRRVRAGASRMGELIDDLLRLANVTRGVLRREIVDLSALARQVAEGLQNAAADRAVEFIIAPDLKAEGDGVLLQLVLENLLGNAWKYTSKHQSARIEFGATRAEGRPVYFVRDDGAGFDIVFANKLFKPFSRLHTLREFEGSGIGLATVSRIIARHGGRIWGEGQVEKGAAFYFTLGEGPHE